MSENQQWLVEFAPGTGWKYDTRLEAVLAAGHFLLELASENQDDPEAVEVIRGLASGRDIEATLQHWNEIRSKQIHIRQIPKKPSDAGLCSLQDQAKEMLECYKPPVRMTLAAAISHASHQVKAKEQSDPKCARDHAQVAEWLTDLKELRRAALAWSALSENPDDAPSEALREVLSGLRGCYDAGTGEV